MILSAAVIGLGLALAQDLPPAEPSAVSASSESDSTTLDLDGTLVPVDAVPISLWLEGYRDELLILEVVEHGSFVNEGDILIRFDTKKIDEQIKRAEFDLRQAREKLANTRDEGRIQEEAAAAGLERAEKQAAWAARKLAGYLDKERSLKVEEIRLREQSTRHNLEDQRDELEQLQKMYREDELVDATEEIVLKRSRRRLASSTAWSQLREQQNEYTLANPEVIKLEGLELEAEQKAAELDRKRRSATLKQASRAAGIERAQFDLHKQIASLDRLKRDLKTLTVRAPRRGLILHGDVEAAPGKAILERGSRASLFKTIMTVADPDRLKIVTDVPESSIFTAHSGTAARITLAAAPDFEAIGRLDVAYLATSLSGDGENLYRAEITFDERDPRLRPGMSCSVSVILEKEEGRAALLPAR